MTLVLEIAPELENQIRQAASNTGIAPDIFVLESVSQRLAKARLYKKNASRRVENRLSPTESRLLEKINQSLSQIQWERYRQLLTKRQTGTLTAIEQQELILLSDQIEEANVKRIEHVAELADLQKTTIPALMKKLGLKPTQYD